MKNEECGGETRTRANIEPILKEVVEILVRDYQPETIILYGSYAYGQPTRHSDIDLFIVKETEKNRFERNVAVKGLVFRPGRGISLQPYVMTRQEIQTRLILGDQFIEEIVEKGVLLYSQSIRSRSRSVV